MTHKQGARTSNASLFAIPAKLAPPPCDPTAFTEADVDRIAGELDAEYGIKPPYSWMPMLWRRGLVGPCAERVVARLEGRA